MRRPDVQVSSKAPTSFFVSYSNAQSFKHHMPKSGWLIGAKRLPTMEKKKKNEELQSRRDFFKKAARTALPIIGAIALAGMPNVVKAAEEAPMGCDWGCTYGCQGGCGRSCSYGCSGSCSGSCSGACKGGCMHSCSYNCSGGCRGYGSSYVSDDILSDKE